MTQSTGNTDGRGWDGQGPISTTDAARDPGTANKSLPQDAIERVKDALAFVDSYEGGRVNLDTEDLRTLLSALEKANAALEAIATSYLVNHTSKYARDTAQKALSTQEEGHHTPSQQSVEPQDSSATSKLGEGTAP